MSVSATWTATNYLSRSVSQPIGAGSYTFSSWAKITSPSSDVAVMANGMTGANTGGNPYWGLSYYQGTVYFNTGSGSSFASLTYSASAAWHHYAGVVRAGLAQEIWIDGVQQTVSTSGSSLSGTLSSIIIGTVVGAPSTSGVKIAESAVWPSDALTTAEIVALSNGASPGTIRPLRLAHYAPLRSNFYDNGNAKPAALGATASALAPTFAADHPNVAHLRFPRKYLRAAPVTVFGGRRPLITTAA